MAANSTVSGSGTLTFTVNNSCGTPIQISKSVWVGKPTISGPTKFGPCLEQIYSYTAPSTTGVNYTWTISNSNLEANGYNNTCEVSGISPVYGGNPFTLTVTMQSNTCSFSTTKCCQSYIQKTPEQCSGGGQLLVVYPNPTSSELTVEYIPEDSTVQETMLVELINPSLNKVYSKETSKTSLTIPVGNLTRGIYYLQVSNKEGVIRRNIFIEN